MAIAHVAPRMKNSARRPNGTGLCLAFQCVKMDDVDTIYVEVKVTSADVASTKVFVVPSMYSDEEVKNPSHANAHTLVSTIY